MERRQWTFVEALEKHLSMMVGFERVPWLDDHNIERLRSTVAGFSESDFDPGLIQSINESLDRIEQKPTDNLEALEQQFKSVYYQDECTSHKPTDDLEAPEQESKSVPHQDECTSHEAPTIHVCHEPLYVWQPNPVLCGQFIEEFIRVYTEEPHID